MINVLTAVGVLFALGVVCAIALALASFYMSVPTDEKESAIRDCLPGINCGACGFSGCDGYAKALAGSKAPTNLCIPGGSSVAKEIASILGTKATEVERKLAYVHCNGTSEVTDTSSNYDGLRSCAAMCLVCGGPNKCKFGCLGCGDCAKACPTEAIRITDRVARVDPEKCIGCGKCVKICPKSIISIIPASAGVAVACSSRDTGAVTRKNCTNGCIACKRCEKICPHGAIAVTDNLATIDYTKCTACGKCRDVCPVGCIEREDFAKRK